MNPAAFSHTQQVEALLKGRALELVKSTYGTFHPEAYSEVFTVTRGEILEYLRQTYKLDHWVRMQPGKDGGFYAIPLSRSFQVYEQYEKGPTRELGNVSQELKVWALFVDFLIRTSGTGLDFK